MSYEIDTLAARLLDAWMANDNIETDTPCGLRAMYAGQNLALGTAVEPSRVWEDGNPTETILDGSCAIQLNHMGVRLTIEQARKAVERVAIYPGVALALIFGDGLIGGDDIGEVIVRNAKIAWVA